MLNTSAEFSFEKIIIPKRIKRVGRAIYEGVAFDMEAAKHTKQDNFAVVEFAKELPFSGANTHKVERGNFPVAQVVVPSPCPVPQVAPGVLSSSPVNHLHY